jgi:pimeloyl-ACP methyl ester carboxylesterase
MNSMQVLDMPGSEIAVTLSVRIDDLEGSGSGTGSRSAPTALIAHGAGSSGDFVQRAFAAPLRAAGWRLVSYDLRGHGNSTAVADEAALGLDRHVQDLLALAARTGATMLGGVSMGAHAAVLAALDATAPRDLAGLLLALPAWTGPPDLVAAANAVQAAELRAVGIAPVLDRIRRDHPGWVADELSGAWPGHDAAAFAAVLAALARSPGPSEAELARIAVPVGIVALDDDPMHPATVAEAWSRLIPRAGLERVAFDAPAADRSVLGSAALRAYRTVVSASR